jgi:glycosidase
VDGWRLDVAHEMPPAFWREFASVCTAAKADSCLVGELIHGDYRQWVAPGILHSGTNYQLSQ